MTPALADASSGPYTFAGTSKFNPDQSFRSMGVFGAFGNADKLVERNDAGLLTFTLKKDLPQQSVVWQGFKDGKDLILGQMDFPGKQAESKFNFVDWTTAVESCRTESGDSIEATFSRAFPAVRYQTTTKEFSWNPADLKPISLSYRNGQGRLERIAPGSNTKTLGSPWVILFCAEPGKSESVPLLFKLQHRPQEITFGEKLTFKFSNSAGAIALMPLEGIRRLNLSQAENPSERLVQSADFWSHALASFPVKTAETYQTHDDRVVVENRFSYQVDPDDWGTRALQIAPVPPVTEMASAHGYPVRWLDAKPEETSVSTYLGPFSYVLGAQNRYSIPIPSSRDAMFTPVRSSNRSSDLAALDQAVLAHPPTPGDRSDGGLGIPIKEYSQAFPLLSSTTRQKIGPRLREAFEDAYDEKNLQTVVEPVTGQKYVMCNKIWCVNEPYDREWYTGRQLDYTCEYTAWVDQKSFSAHWKAIKGLYDYFRIYSDWAWSGTESSTFAYALCGDGMNFAMEGMLGVARLAKREGDAELSRDATYRSAKQALCTYASFFMTNYVKSVDYATWTDTSYDYATKKGRYQICRMPADQVRDTFGIDIYTDSTGIKLCRPLMFWHSASAFYWNNPDLYRLYSEYLYKHAYWWEYVGMPADHPGWASKNVIEKFDNQPYGSNLTLAHLDARTVLFGDDAPTLKKYTTNLQTDIAPLYTVRYLADVASAGAPQVWAPCSICNVRSSTWDGDRKRLTVDAVPLAAEPVHFDFCQRTPHPNGPDRGPAPTSVTIAGRAVQAHQVAGGYWRVETKALPGTPIHLTIQY